MDGVRVDEVTSLPLVDSPPHDPLLQSSRMIMILGLPSNDTDIRPSLITTAIHNVLKRHTPPIKFPKWTIKIPRNVHRRVRDGKCFLLFATSEEADTAYTILSQASINKTFLLSVVTTVDTKSKESFGPLVLAVERCAGSVRDHAFAPIPFHLRRCIQLDGEGIYSLTDINTSRRIACLIPYLLSSLRPDSASPARRLRVLDGMAGCGGNSFGFLDSISNLHLHAVEINSARAEMLQYNCNLLYKVDAEVQTSLHLQSVSSEIPCVNTPSILPRQTMTIWNESIQSFLSRQCQHHLPTTSTTPLYDVIFLDPPWGGPQYTATENSLETPFSLPFPLDTTPATFKFWTIIDSVSMESTLHLSHIVNRCFASQSLHPTHPSLASLVMIKVGSDPRCMTWIQQLTENLVWVSNNNIKNDTNDLFSESSLEVPRERLFPFLFNFGASIRLLCFVSNAVRDPVVGVASNASLNALVSKIQTWHQLIGDGEHHPRFYCFEKRRWVDLKKWKGSKEPVDVSGRRTE